LAGRAGSARRQTVNDAVTIQITQRGADLRNGANSVIYYGKGGEIASNRHDEQEMTALCLRILQAALVYVNTLMLQDVLAEDDWTAILTPEDRRGLTPLFWQHVLPYGEVKLDMTARLNIRTTTPGDASTQPVDSP